MIRMASLITVAVGLTFLAAFSVVAPAHAAITAFNIDHKAVATAGHGGTTVSGEIQCTAGDTAELLAAVIQAKAGAAGTGFSTLFTCTGASQAWSIDVPISFPSGGDFRNGPATAAAIANDTTDHATQTLINGIVSTGPGK
jgi:hypothetical protein